ncbi:NACHT, LRR and PYD domains-containing protein 3-like [Micropterus dolomieu]|uniref:NACHT, LRR and PYD domains-containing protein 3-like n=1 Tax=Micropterus dolomieu TaxID=147949 RepID=UPI001E8CCFD2|nr:NACHT, LRR and PYD domains-containing protein 3-like [Micropterus dolomieu]
METHKKVLLQTLEKLNAEDFKKFKWYLLQKELLEGFPTLPKSQLEKADRMDTVDHMVQIYSINTIEVARIVLVLMNQNDLVKNLSNTISVPRETIAPLCQLKLKSNLKKKFQCVFEGIAKAGNPTLLNQIYTELYNICELTLDTNTVNRNLKVSNNNRMVTLVTEEQPYPDHPERFDHWYQQLCRNGLTGRCYLEVEWEGVVQIAVTYREIGMKGKGYGNRRESLILCKETLKTAD